MTSPDDGDLLPRSAEPPVPSVASVPGVEEDLAHKTSNVGSVSLLVVLLAVGASLFGAMLGVVGTLRYVASNSCSCPTSSAATPAVPTVDAAASAVAVGVTSTIPSPASAAPSTTIPTALAFADAVGSDSAQWMLQLDPNRPETDGLVLKGSGAGSNYPLLMIRDFNNAPIAWVAPHGGLTVTDNIRVRTGVFEDDGVSMRRWTDSIELTGPGGFSWDGATLVQTTVGGAGGADPLPANPELWLRVIDNTGPEPRHLVIPAFLEE